MYLSDTERLAIIAGCLGFLLLCFLLMVCKLSTRCCLHKHCPFKSADQEYNISSDAAKAKQYESTGKQEHFALTHPQVDRWRRPPCDDSTSSEGEDCHNVDIERVAVHKTASSKSSSSDTPGTDAPDENTSCLVKGEVEFSIFYPDLDDPDSEAKNQLHIWVRRVGNLVFRKREKVKVCVKVQLLNKATNIERILTLFQVFDAEEQEANVEYETQTSHKSVSKPLEWTEFRRVPLVRKECKNRVIRLVCCLYDEFSQYTQLGQIIVNMNEVTLDPTFIMQRELSAMRQESKGELLTTLNYLPTAQKLVVLPVECRQLKLVESKYPSTVFLRVSMTSRGSYTKKKTHYRETQSRIVWNEPVTFDLPSQQLADVNLVITVRQSLGHPERAKDLTIGKVVIGAFNGPEQGQQQWRQMIAHPRQPQTAWQTLY